MSEMLHYVFFQHALWMGLLCSIACGIIGSYVVIKRISFISGSIAHSAFGGIGLSYLLGINPLLGATGFGMITALLIGYVKFKFKQQEDTLIGVIWALGMAIGIICIQLTQGYAADLFSYMFGNILLISQTDLWIVGSLDVGIIICVGLLFNPLRALTFDEEYAEILNIPVKKIYLLLLELITLTTVILLKAVGIILVIALLTLPAATAKNLTNNLKTMMGLAVGLGCLCTTCGILLSYSLNLPSGPLIIVLSSITYLVSLWATKR